MKKILIIPGGLHMGGAERVAANLSALTLRKGNLNFIIWFLKGMTKSMARRSRRAEER